MPPFGKAQFSRLSVFYLCVMSICNFNYFISRFGFEGRIWVLIVPSPDPEVIKLFHA